MSGRPGIYFVAARDQAHALARSHVWWRYSPQDAARDASDNVRGGEVWHVWQNAAKTIGEPITAVAS